MEYTFYCTVARGLEAVLGEELKGLEAKEISAQRGVVYFKGTLDVLYRVCLWSRTANHVYRVIKEFSASHNAMLYDQVRRMNWEQMIGEGQTFRVDVTMPRTGPRGEAGAEGDFAQESRRERPSGAGSRPGGRGLDRGRGDRSRAFSERPEKPSGPAHLRPLTHSHYVALKIKDAIVDRLREKTGARPDVDRDQPDVIVHAYVDGKNCILALDAVGASLHERGYRTVTGDAPLKETLAAGLVLLTGWDGKSTLYDPMCGSGTLLCEAALFALNIAPGLFRPSFAFEAWEQFDENAFGRIRKEATNARRAKPKQPFLFGSDLSRESVHLANRNLSACGVEGAVKVQTQDFFSTPSFVSITGERPVLLTNPPYGKRIGVGMDFGEFCKKFGDTLKHSYKGWTAYVFAGELEFAKKIGLRTSKRIELYNGPIECRLFEYKLF